MNSLILIQHTMTPRAMNYHNFTINPEAWYGILKTPFGSFPAAWSGWTCGGCIALYTYSQGRWARSWVDGDDVDRYHITCNVNYSEARWSETPFFARAV